MRCVKMMPSDFFAAMWLICEPKSLWPTPLERMRRQTGWTRFWSLTTRLWQSTTRDPTHLRTTSAKVRPWSKVLSVHQQWLTYSVEQSLSWEANRFSASQEVPHFYGTRRFITAFTRARHLSISWASSIQSIPPPLTYWRSILILSSHTNSDMIKNFLALFVPEGLLSCLLADQKPFVATE